MPASVMGGGEKPALPSPHPQLTDPMTTIAPRFRRGVSSSFMAPAPVETMVLVALVATPPAPPSATAGAASTTQSVTAAGGTPDSSSVRP